MILNDIYLTFFWQGQLLDISVYNIARPIGKQDMCYIYGSNANSKTNQFIYIYLHQIVSIKES